MSLKIRDKLDGVRNEQKDLEVTRADQIAALEYCIELTLQFPEFIFDPVKIGRDTYRIDARRRYNSVPKVD